MRISDYRRALTQALTSLIIILLSGGALVWINQTPLAAWWQQTYHQNSPWADLDYPGWASGADLMDASLAAKAAFFQSLDDAHKVDIPVFITIIWPTLHLPPLVQATVIPPPEIVPEPEPEPIEETTLPVTHVTLHADQRVLFIGDSMMEGIAPHASAMLRHRWNIASLNLSKRSTGLTYPNAFDWPQNVEETLDANADIGLMVVFLGPNDPWDMPSGKGTPFLRFHSAAWETRYRERIQSLLTLANDRQVPVMWIGPPAMRDDQLNSGVAWLNTLYESETVSSHNLFLPVNALLGYQDNAYSDFQDIEGRHTRLRSDDGVHFTPTAQRIIAEKILSAITVIPAPTDEGSQSGVSHSL